MSERAKIPRFLSCIWFSANTINSKEGLIFLHQSLTVYMCVWRQQFAGGRRQLVAWGFWCRGRHSQFTRHDPRGTFRRSQNETFSRKLPRSRRRKRRVSFPSAHQDYQRRVPPIRLTCWYLCCGNFPSANYSGRWKPRQGGLIPSTPAGTTSSPGSLFHLSKGWGSPKNPKGPIRVPPTMGWWRG